MQGSFKGRTSFLKKRRAAWGSKKLLFLSAGGRFKVPCKGCKSFWGAFFQKGAFFLLLN
jgi:hypothetical protein